MQSSYTPPAELLERLLLAFPLDAPARPTLDELQRLIDATFWASLRTDEGQPARPALSLVPPGVASEAFEFSESLSLSVEHLAQLSPALRHPDVHVGVWRHQGGLSLWGLLFSPVDSSLRVRATSPGVLHLSAGPHLVATLAGERGQLVAAGQAFQFNELLTRALGRTADLWLRARQNDYLRHIARRMREHRRGGTLVIVPRPDGPWTRHLSLRHRLVLPVQDIVNAWRDETEASQRQNAAAMIPPGDVSPESLEERASAMVAENIAYHRARSLSDRIGDVTAMDGAAVVTHELALLGFGAKIITDVVPPKILGIRPVVGDALEQRSLESLGGMRHQSAARFVTAQRDCIALVVSQDGMVSLFSWLEDERAVLVARELELLLWSA
jgi:hypothetical protein